jgi:predicted amidophosphoribosyltransferase
MRKQTMKCSECGKEIQSDKKLCKECKKRLLREKIIAANYDLGWRENKYRDVF